MLLVRSKESEQFKFLGGSIYDNENLKETVIREAKEEINCEVEVDGNPVFYYLHNDEKNIEILLSHKIIKGEPKPTSEIEEVKWFDVNALLENIMENVKPVIDKFI